MTSLKFQANLCAIKLCFFGQTRSGCVATYFNLLSSTSAGSSSNGYAVVPEYFGQNEEPAGSNEERTRKKPTFVPKTDLIDAIVFPKHIVMNFYYSFRLFYIKLVHFLKLFSYGNSFCFFCVCFIYCVGAGISTLMYISDELDPYNVRWMMEKTLSVTEEMKEVVIFFPPESASFLCTYND